MAAAMVLGTPPAIAIASDHRTILGAGESRVVDAPSEGVAYGAATFRPD